MINISIGQVVCLGDRPGVVCKKYNAGEFMGRTMPASFGVVFFDDLGAALLKLNDASAWTVTDEIASQDVVDELMAGNERAAAESEAEAERVYQNSERLIRAEEAQEARRLRALRNLGN